MIRLTVAGLGSSLIVLLGVVSCATGGAPQASDESTPEVSVATGADTDPYAFDCGDYGELVDTPPEDLPYLTGRAESGCFSWQTLLALSLQADHGAGGPVLSGADGPTRWESWLTPDELFPPGRDPCSHSLTLSMSTGISAEVQAEVLEVSPDASCLDFVLLDRDGRGVWHEVHLSPAYAEFVRSNGHDEKEPEGGSDFQFPDGAIAVKTSWKATRELPDSRKYYVREARRHDPLTGCGDPEPMALVGLHLIKKTATFPRWMWATFEHDSNAPSKSRPEELAQDWTFYSAAYAEQPESWNRPCLKGRTDCAPTEVVRLTAESLDAAHVNAYWQELLPEGSVWRNYRLVGTQWQHSSTPDGDQRLANTTMETACQDRADGCLGCHSQSPHDMSFVMQHAPD